MDNKAVAKHFYEIIVSENRLDEVSEYISRNCVLNMNGKIIPIGFEGMIEHLKAVRRTYPEYSMKITRQFVDSDYVISEFIMTGTHEGEWLGMKPTHKELSFSGINIDKITDGKIVEHGGAVNTFETLWENGLIQAV
ncbi:MAG: ester cyclase [Alphaproteobacteria bacterium]|nr:ester cyclase [Alphaproteobacteria bacterium]